MRPGSASRNGLSSSGGVPPGTGMRPGSGRKPPSTARVRTGVAPTGPGTQAAQGIALSANINVSDRPVTGHGVSGMRVQTANTGGRIVQDTAYYVGLLRKKINDVNSESIKLNSEVEHQSRDNSQYVQLERKYETLIKEKETLEGQLADYNLALDKIRSATDPDDVQQMSMHMADKNRQLEQDLDRIFIQRRQRENEINQINNQMDTIHQQIQKRINDLDPGRLRAYNELLIRQKESQDRLLQQETRLNNINSQIRAYENDDKSNQYKKEYLALERSSQSLKKDLTALQEELDIANMDPKEAHTQFVQRVQKLKDGTKQFEETANRLRDQIQQSKRQLEEMNSNTYTSANDGDENDQEKYELLVKRDQDMSNFIDSFEETKTSILKDQREVQYMVVALLEHIGKGIDDSTNLPTQEAHDEMENAKVFKEKNLQKAQSTMENLLVERKKRERELDLLRSSEPKLHQELKTIRENINKMRSEMELFQDLDRMRREFNETKSNLQDLKSTYIKRRDSIRQQLTSIQMEYESAKKTLNSNEINRELDDTEKRLKHYERTIFDLREFVEMKTRETDYDHVKNKTLKLMDGLNQWNIKENQGTNSYFGAQAKY